MIGDPKQCQSIEAGPVIDLLRNALGEDAIPQILTSIRQKTEREREITGLFRAGKAAEALEMKQRDGTAELVAGGRQSTVQRVAQLWRERNEANPTSRIGAIFCFRPVEHQRIGLKSLHYGRGRRGESAVVIFGGGWGGSWNLSWLIRSWSSGSGWV